VIVSSFYLAFPALLWFPSVPPSPLPQIRGLPQSLESSCGGHGDFTLVLEENVEKCGQDCTQLVGAIVTDEASFVSNGVVVSCMFHMSQ